MFGVGSPVRGDLPWLDFVATGGQSHVFGSTDRVVKIPRRSWQGGLARVLVHPATPVRALGVLGGLVEPFELVRGVRFRGPVVVGGKAVPGRERVWSARHGVVSARLAAEDFLDRRMARATAGEAADLMEGLVGTLETIRARGWHVLDFIMSNFAVGADGRVRLVDAGLLIPASHLRGPSQQLASRVFVRCLASDYRAVLRAVADRGAGDAGGRARLERVMERLGPRLATWRAGRADVAPERALPTPAGAVGDAPLSVFPAPKGGGRKMPLTARGSPGYTPTHHAITSEN